MDFLQQLPEALDIFLSSRLGRLFLDLIPQIKPRLEIIQLFFFRQVIYLERDKMSVFSKTCTFIQVRFYEMLHKKITEYETKTEIHVKMIYI